MRVREPGHRPGRLLRALFRVPVPLLRWRLGAIFGHRVVLIEHFGRRTGVRRQTAVEVIGRDRRSGTITVASGYGGRADWYRNLRANPRATVVDGARRRTVEAFVVSPDDAAGTMVGYAQQHPRIAPRVARMLGYEVDGTDEDYAALGRALRFLELAPVRRLT
ncbi:nitroreductase family deazaflavin-dependent oxidoreductase [Asanoa sp. WMMD1127]|uniref:nitroreductase family deazaflavin-dependent oxidoreductase n=1 Tax=Asanoa sp. WMMD1127 TaxID=3016107 RepID=UPI002417F95C|nr:nitroreductase family deazaflavin-dependent oxidoreductase [Asanoa sp. WMMD1127]MDG4824961.1 nitroreductase family deazaflavin-dependent oxidoreductase [Asanoa sp. WMMD1127]